MPLQEAVVGNLRLPLLVLLGAAVLILLIGCANVGSLILAAGISRRQEFAVRSALGAGAGRLVRQLLTESIVLAFFSAVLATILASWGIQLFMFSLSQRFSVPQITFEWSVPATALGVAFVTGFLSGLLPAVMIPNRSVGRPIHNRVRSILVVSEIALTTVLLVGAGLLLKSFVLLHQNDIGIQTDNVLTADLSLSKRYEDADARRRFLAALLESIEALPGVDEAAVLTNSPLSGGSRETFTIDGIPDPAPRQGHVAAVNVISSAFFRVLGIPSKAKRGFGPQDDTGAARIAIINETMARQFWPDNNPVGKRLRFYYDKNPENWVAIVGVAGDFSDSSDRAAGPRPQVFVPYQQSPYRFLPYAQSAFVSLVVRTAGPPVNFAREVRARIWAVDKDQPVSNMQPMSAVLAQTVGDRRLYLSVLGVFAFIAVFISLAGIYGVVSFAASSRTREIGIRVAVGASNAQVLRLVLKQGVWLMIIGGSIGIAGSMLLTRTLSSLLYGITPTDPSTIVMMTVAFAFVALLASYIPARRAAKADPMAALRCD